MDNSNDGLALLKQATKLNDAKKFVEVLQLLKDEELEKYQNANLYLARARANGNLKNLDELLKDCEKALSIDPGNFMAYNYLGNFWLGKKEFDKAIDEYNKAGELNPTSTSVLLNLARVWLKKGVYDKVIEYSSKVININPRKTLAYNIRGFALYRTERFYEAIEDLSKSIELNSNDERVYNDRGNAYSRLERFEEGKRDYLKAMSIKPQYHHPFNNMGMVYYKESDFDQAIKNFSKAIELKPDYALAYRNRGNLWYTLEEYEKAIEDFENAIKFDASNSLIQSLLNEAKLKLGEKIAKTEASQNETSFFISDILDKIEDETIKKALREKAVHAIASMNAIKKHTTIEKPVPVVHYTKLFVADLLIRDNLSRLRYGNVVNMNDPEEGRILGKLLREKDAAIDKYFEETKLFEDGDTRHNHIYLGSFLPAPDGEEKINSHEDELIMWRTYGKDENKNEAAGCSIVIDKNFFNWPTPDKMVQIMTLENATALDVGPSVQIGEVLHRVLYYDKVKRTIIRNDGFSCDGINIELDNLTAAIKALIDFRIDSGASRIIDDILYRILSELRHRFKAASYAFENEYRVIQYCDPSSKIGDNFIVKVDTSASLPRPFYIESANYIPNFIRKIYIGPKVPNPERWMYLEVIAKQKELSNIKVEPSAQKFQ